MKLLRYLSMGLFIIVLILLGGEALVRWRHFDDFPLYDRPEAVKYIAKPGQRGAFMGTNDWCFNNLSMPVCADFDATKRPSVLVVGNSIVMNGNPFRQADKLVSALQRDFGTEAVVWPVAIGGWSNMNEMAYLDAHPEVAANADFVAWEYMAGGLSDATPWRSEYMAPTARPICALCYVVRRYALLRIWPSARLSELPVDGAVAAENIANFDRHLAALAARAGDRTPGVVWLYPKQAELLIARAGKEWLPERAAVAAAARKNRFKVIDLATVPEWRTEFYTDGVHPSVAGTQALADILRREIVALRR